MNSEKQGGCELHSCLGLWDGGPKSSRELGREETGPERVRKWEGVPSTFGRWRDGEGGTGIGSLGWGEGRPPPFGAPDAVGQHEDEDNEQEAHHGSEAHQPRLQAQLLCGCRKGRGGGTQRREGTAPQSERKKGARVAQIDGGLGKGLGLFCFVF